MTELSRIDPISALAQLCREETDPQTKVALSAQLADLYVKVETLRQSQERFEWEKQERQSKIAFSQAFAEFKKNVPALLKNKHVHFVNQKGQETSYWHIDLEAACDVVVPALLEVGITHRWKSEDAPGGFTRVTCYLRHVDGYEEEGATLAGPTDVSGGKNLIQGVGSAASYLHRYTLLASCGLVAKNADTDGLPKMEGLEEALNAIGAASTLDELKTVFFAAWKKASEAKDEAAKADLNAAKEKRKGELEHA